MANHNDNNELMIILVIATGLLLTIFGFEALFTL